MKRILTIMAAIVCLCGCEKIFTPMSVTLSADGETVTVHTSIQPQTLDILNYDGEGVKTPEYNEESQTYTITNDWLTASISEASYDNGQYELILTAVKNTTGKRRTLYVGGMDKNYRKTATVMRNSYVTLNKHHYSVPIEYIGKRVEIIYDADTLQIFYGMKLITTHTRDDRPHAYTRKESHNLPGRHGSYEKDLDEIYQRAATIDNIVLTYLKEVAELKKYPPLAFRACKGIMSLEKKYGLDRLVAACACASQGRRYGFNEVKEILDKGEDIDFLSPQHGEEWEAPRTPAQHKNIRGREYFAPKSNKKN